MGFSALCWLQWVRYGGNGGGVVWLSFHFLYLVVSFPGGRLSVVGYFVFRYRFSLGIFGNVAVLYILSC